MKQPTKCETLFRRGGPSPAGQYLPKDGARCALDIGHDGPHVFARAEPIPDSADPLAPHPFLTTLAAPRVLGSCDLCREAWDHPIHVVAGLKAGV